MLKPVTDTSNDLATALLTHYSFDLSGYSVSELIRRWKHHYPLEWIHIAVIEALYQGRYKAVSVQQILNFWQRRGQATYHFNMEFERLICSKFPESLTSISTPVLYPAKKITTVEKTNYHLASSSVNSDPSPTKVDRDYSQKKLAPLKVVREAEMQLASKGTEGVVVSSTPTAINAATTQVDSELQPSLKTENSLQADSPVSPASNKPQQLLSDGVNHRAIGQFTPDKSDRTESFTSKLKAMSGG
ncbi:hypothetical protein BV372_31865 [Nostoc sp. T09]|uniref:hypothetical protein n=1 Tax=Nostoc sp. T09 TaxID=1932621 RepID=UPI000A37CD18|nr:hypothetical protein BV372_31865 [Nostoc sp. T09]